MLYEGLSDLQKDSCGREDKNVDVREVQIFVGKLAANAGDRAVRKCDAYSLNA